MLRRALCILSLTLIGLLVLNGPPVFAQSTDGSDQNQSSSDEQLPSEDPTPSLTNAGEIDIDALAKEFNLPSHILNPRIESERLELLLLPLTETQLAAASEAWQRIVQEQTQDVVDATLRVSELDGETADIFRERVRRTR